jgi:basic membrane protein A
MQVKLKKLRRLMRLAAMGVAAITLAACGSASQTSSSTSTKYSAAHPLKVCFMFYGPTDDHNFNQQAYTNMLSVEKEFGSKISVTYKENVLTGPQSASIAQQFIADGCKLIFVNTAGYQDSLGPIAKTHPNVRFEEFSSSYPLKNFGFYDINVLDSSYVAGVIAGYVAKNGLIGMVNAFPIPSIVAEVNGIELGAQSVNPKAVEHAIYISSFYNPPVEQQAGLGLIDEHVGVLVDGQNDANVCVVAEAHSVPCIGDTIIGGASYAPKEYLVSYMYNWTPIFSTVINDMLNGKPVPNNIIMGWREGATVMSPFGPAYYKLLTPAERQHVAQVEAELKSGALQVFKGPIEDQSGRVMIPAGQVYTPEQIMHVTWMVKGVISSTE